MGYTYVFADLHGRYDLLMAAMDAIYAHANEPGTIVLTGDYVDRGPESRQILDELIHGEVRPGWIRRCLKGNHEDIMLQCYTGRANLAWWLQNGGVETLVSYGQPLVQHLIPGIVPNEHINWIESLPLMHVDEHRVFVHAGVIADLPIEEQEEQTIIWMLYDDDDAGGHASGRHVVHGHHQFANGPILKAGRTDLDTFAWFTGRLVIGVFDDAVPGGPVDLITVQLAPHAAAKRFDVDGDGNLRPRENVLT